MIIGIPKEILHEERRVAATPETVQKYTQLGFLVLVQSGAGLGIYQSDNAYRTAGAEIAAGADEVFARADLVLKVKQPTFNESLGRHEVELLREGAIIVTFLHPAAPGNHRMVKMLCDKNITSFTMDGIPRISRAQKMDALSSMSTVTGYKAVLIAANHLPKFMPMIGTAIGTVKPATFLIVGAGVVGLQSIATAKRLGAVTRVVDIREDARRESASLGAKVAGFDVPAETAVGRGGYAKALPAEWLEKERELLAPLVAEGDAVILSALVPGELAPLLITEEMAAKMQPGSVIVDVAIDQGGNCAATVAGKELTKAGVYICGIQNIPGSMPVHATWLYANNMFNYIENLFKKGLGQPDYEDEIVKNSLVTRQGKIVHTGTLKAMGGS